MKTILIFSYYSYKDPVFQGAVLPYFVNFKERRNINFVLLTFEHDAYRMSNDEVESITAYLRGHGITWKRLRWRSGKLKFVKKIIDFVSSLFYATLLIIQFRIRIIYTEGFPGAILSYYISRFTGSKHIVHTFEPHADYMIEAGVWTERSWEARIQYWHEMKIAKHATAIMTATNGMIKKLIASGVSPDTLYRVPSCIDTGMFRFEATQRLRIRQLYGIADDEPVLVYMGKFGGMYMAEEAFNFFQWCQELVGARIMILTTEPSDKIESLVSVTSLIRDRLIIKRLPHDEIPAYLSAADMAFVAVRQKPAKKYCCPIKTGEYLSCGLPVIVPLGISDDAELLRERGIGILMKSTEKSACLEVINEWKSWIKGGDVDRIRASARKYVVEDRSIDQFAALYLKLFETL